MSISRFKSLPAAVLLLAMYALAVTSMRADTPTFDEQGFIVRGLAYLRGDEEGSRRIRVGHPIGLNVLNTFLLADDPFVSLPTNDPSWQGTSFHRPAELMLWEIGNDVEHIMFLSRLPTVWLGLLMAAVAGRWAGRMTAGWRRQVPYPRALEAEVSTASSGDAAAWAGLLALVLIAFDPNVLAHTRLATTDLGLAAAAALAGFTLWRFLKHPSIASMVLAGVGLGLLLNTKFTALLFLPMFAFLVLLSFWESRDSATSARTSHAHVRNRLLLLVAYPVVACFVLWVTNGFDVGRVSGAFPILGQVEGATVPLAGYLDQLLDIGDRLQVSTPSFLLGRYSDTGWWYYFPVAFLLKTPLPTLILLAWAVVLVVKRAVSRDRISRSSMFDLAAVLLPAMGYFAVALTSEINLGYRHLLPILPFLAVFIGAMLGDTYFDRTSFASDSRHRLTQQRATVVVTLAAALVAVGLWIYPHFLAYFNVLAGGPRNGWHALVDSNIDWGQDLARLRDKMAELQIDRVWLSYFGEGRPEYYGIAYDGLDSFPPRLMSPSARPFYQADPAPGWYAISVTNLQGVHFNDHDQFRYFRDRAPDARAGYSILLYYVPPRGEPVDLLLDGVQVDEIMADRFALLGTNDVTLRWIDGREAIIIPAAGRRVWLAHSGDISLDPLLAPFLMPESTPGASGDDGILLTPVGTDAPEAGPGSVTFAADDGRITFLDVPYRAVDEGGITLTTAWRQEGPSRPLKMFVHALNANGEIVTQWDGLGVAWEGWREGDTLIRRHRLDWPEGIAPGEYRLVAGLYDPESLKRWQAGDGADTVELGWVAYPPSDMEQ